MGKQVKHILIVLAALAGVILLAALLAGPGFAQGRAELSFRLFRGAYDRAAAGEDVVPFGVTAVERHEDTTDPGGATRAGVEFETGGWGFGSQTTYFGIVYSEDGGPLGFQCLNHPWRADGDGWLWEETDGDNRERAVRLDENWYYYEMRF